jgi:hypothetical protein
VTRPVSTEVKRAGALKWVAVALVVAAGCRDVDVVTESYATLKEAAAAAAIERGWLPRDLPPTSHEIREAHDLDSSRRWGLFNFPPHDADALRSILAAEISLAGQTCNPPRRIEWWPLLLRERLDHEKIAATGLRAYSGRQGELVFAVNWSQGRAYYWTRE